MESRRANSEREDQQVGYVMALVATLSSAALIVVAFPPHGLRALAWVALVPLLVTLRRCSPRRAALLGAVWGMAGAYGVTDWLPPTVAVYYQQPLWLGLGLFVVAGFLMGGVYYAAFGAFYSATGRSRSTVVAISLPLLAASAWVAAELGRARVLTGNPWGLLGYTQSGADAWLTVLQVADLGGVYAVTFLVVLANASLAEAWLAALDRTDRPGSKASMVAVGVGCCVLLAGLAYGRNRLAAPVGPSDEGTRIAIVQGNLDLGSQWSEELYGRNLGAYLELTQEIGGDSDPVLVFWPENAMTFFVETEPTWRAAIAMTTAPLDVELLSGAPRFEPGAEITYFNSAFVLSPDGQVLARYDKEQLLPFAEYFPFGSVAFLHRRFGRVREFTPGEATGPLPTRAGAAGILICNEAMFPRLARKRVAAGADYLVNLSNDTWVADPEFAMHQFQIVSLRAVETRRYLVRASTSGPSGVVDPHGRVVSGTEPFTRTAVAGRIHAVGAEPFYARYGDLFAFACTGLTLLAALVAIVAHARPE